METTTVNSTHLNFWAVIPMCEVQKSIYTIDMPMHGLISANSFVEYWSKTCFGSHDQQFQAFPPDVNDCGHFKCETVQLNSIDDLLANSWIKIEILWQNLFSRLFSINQDFIFRWQSKLDFVYMHLLVSNAQGPVVLCRVEIARPLSEEQTIGIISHNRRVCWNMMKPAYMESPKHT